MSYEVRNRGSGHSSATHTHSTAQHSSGVASHRRRLLDGQFVHFGAYLDAWNSDVLQLIKNIDCMKNHANQKRIQILFSSKHIYLNKNELGLGQDPFFIGKGVMIRY